MTCLKKRLGTSFSWKLPGARAFCLLCLCLTHDWSFNRFEKTKNCELGLAQPFVRF